MSASSKAVFLSYASQDAEAAGRICDALRAAGLEVWFDRAELRGGDAWDALIRKRIKECALFVPIVSANTQAREEGYFRREWNLAAQRTLDMADERAFLLPVVIDATSDANARVPEKFREVQWTRLPAGEAGQAFARRARELLGESAPPAAPHAAAGNASAVEPRPLRPAPRRRGHWLAAGVLALALAGFAAWTLLQRDRAAPARTAGVTIDSLAVLPLANLSGDPGQEYFADGMTEALITELAQIRALKVISRTSVMQYKGARKPLPEIARALGVAGIVEGSVLRDGDQVKITVQLIAAPSDAHLWAQSYVREMRNVLALQSDVARAIAQQVKVTLTPAERAELTSARAVNPEAYDLYLRARSEADRPRNYLRVIELLEQAVATDPDYASAWGALGYSLLIAFDDQELPRGEAFARAQRATRRAIELDPDDLDAMKAQYAEAVVIQRDYAGTERAVRRIVARFPGDEQARYWLSLLLSVHGRFDEAIAEARRAVDLAPGSTRGNAALVWAYFSARRYDECIAQARRTVDLAPESLDAYLVLGECLDAKGAYDEGARALQRAWVLRGEDQAAAARLVTAQAQGGYRARVRAALEHAVRMSARKSTYWGDVAAYHAVLGDTDPAFENLERAFREHDAWLWNLQNPAFDSLRGDPRWHAFLRRLGLGDTPMAKLPAAPARAAPRP